MATVGYGMVQPGGSYDIRKMKTLARVFKESQDNTLVLITLQLCDLRDNQLAVSLLVRKRLILSSSDVLQTNGTADVKHLNYKSVSHISG